jgi:phospholipid/cholesterol/gamma-HCH transport system substrate-binding protein
MYEQTNYLAVGLFVLIGAIVLLAVGSWVGGVGKTVPMSQYTIIFERDVNGLSEGSPVRYMGVAVGQVTTIQLFHAQRTAIEVRIEVASTTPVDGGTYASLGYQGITGVAFVNLAADAGEHEPLAVVAGHAYPVIRTRDVGIAALLNSGPEMLARVNTLLDNAGQLLDEKNRDSATLILENLEQVTGALAEQRSALAAVPARMNESLDKLQDTLELAAEIAADARPDLLASMQSLRQTTDRLANASERVEHWLVENDAAIDSFLADGVGETAALVASMQAATRELEKLGAELRSNPSRLIHRPKLEPVVVAQ